MNIYDISEKAGVSIATVSRVLNNNPHVSEATRRKVLRVMNQAGYVPNAFARGLGLGSMHTIGLLCPDASDPYQSTALSCLEAAFRRRDYRCILTCTGDTAADRTASLEAIREQKVDAVVLMGSSFGELDAKGNQIIRELTQSTLVAMLNAENECEQVYSVCCDDCRATREAVTHLIGQGRKRILYLYHSGNQSGQNKLAGYRQALETAGISEDPDLIHLCGTDFDMDSVMDLLAALHHAGIVFDAVMTSEDRLAVAAAKFCLRNGLRIPQDISIIGYNNLPVCRYCEPELSSMDNHLPWLCEMVAETVVSALQGKEVPHRQMRPASLFERASSKC